MRSYNTKGLYLTPQREEVIRGAYEFGKLTYLEGREYLIKDNPILGIFAASCSIFKN